jgi:hypothetical protein
LGVKIRVRHSIDRLADDQADIARSTKPKLAKIVRENADEGRNRARAFARLSAGAHGKHYPKAITSEATGLLEAEFGPDAGMPQGGMSFERGSRNQPPHNDLAQAADLVAPAMEADVRKLLARLFG